MQTLTVPVCPDRDSRADQKWITERPTENDFEKSFDKHVTEHLQFTTFFGNVGWEPLLHLSGDYYPDLVCEFYATMLHKMDSKLSFSW